MDPYIGELRMFPYSIRKDSRTEWHLCDGGFLDKNQWPKVFDVIGYNFGGNGSNLFALPDMRARAPICFGDKTGAIGIVSGANETMLTEKYIPIHTHAIQVTNVPPNDRSAVGNLITKTNDKGFAPRGGSTVVMAGKTITSSQVPLPNMQPFLGMAIYIAVKGIMPSRA